MKRFGILGKALVLAMLASCGGNVGGGGAVTPVTAAAADQVAPRPVPKAAVRRPLSVAMTGDIMMGTLYPTSKLPVDDGRHLFDDVREVLSGANVAVGNLEGAIGDRGELNDFKRSRLANGVKNIYAFRMPERYAPYLKQAGYDFVSMANNHSYDFGTGGQTTTRRALDAAGVAYAGNPGHEMAVREIDGVRYGFAAFGYNQQTVLMREEATVRRIVTALRDTADVVIVSFHGGGEGSEFRHVGKGMEYQHGEARGDLRRFAHLCIDCGADVVYGHGPHVVRGVELYKGHFIAYSLGNFCTPTGISVAGITGYAPVITVTINDKGEFVDGRIHSFIQQRGVGPRATSSGAVVKEIRGLSEADFPQSPLVIEADGTLRRR